MRNDKERRNMGPQKKVRHREGEKRVDNIRRRNIHPGYPRNVRERRHTSDPCKKETQKAPVSDPRDAMLEIYQWAEDEHLDSPTMRNRLLPALEKGSSEEIKAALKACSDELQSEKDTKTAKRRLGYLYKILDTVDMMNR